MWVYLPSRPSDAPMAVGLHSTLACAAARWNRSRNPMSADDDSGGAESLMRPQKLTGVRSCGQWLSLMDYEQLVAHFGGPTKAAEALGLEDRRAVATWKNRRIPSKWQIKAENVSNGALQADQEARDEAAEIARDFAESEKRAAA